MFGWGTSRGSGGGSSTSSGGSDGGSSGTTATIRTADGRYLSVAAPLCGEGAQPVVVVGAAGGVEGPQQWDMMDRAEGAGGAATFVLGITFQRSTSLPPLHLCATAPAAATMIADDEDEGSGEDDEIGSGSSEGGGDGRDSNSGVRGRSTASSGTLLLRPSGPSGEERQRWTLCRAA